MDSDSPPPSVERVQRIDLETHEFAQYILQEHGTYFPKWATDTDSSLHLKTLTLSQIE